MGYTPRIYHAHKLYALSIRALEGLPFVPNHTVNLIIKGAIARTQRDSKVTLCHYLWMGNHAHCMAIFHDAEQAVKFYGEVQKKITESYKRLLGVERLRLWEKRPVVAQVLDIKAAIDQVAYLYANPSRAHLVEGIAVYCGASSWSAFQWSKGREVDACHREDTVWVRPAKTPLIPHLSLKKHEDEDFCAQLSAVGIPHPLELYPNAWMAVFGVTSSQAVTKLNQRIEERIREKEATSRSQRQESKVTVIGVNKLQRQSILQKHTPSRVDRRVYVISSDIGLRVSFIKYVQDLCVRARECYRDALMGIERRWPHGMFRPPLRHLASVITF
jgi:hypothetical protein